MIYPQSRDLKISWPSTTSTHGTTGQVWWFCQANSQWWLCCSSTSFGLRRCAKQTAASVDCAKAMMQLNQMRIKMPSHQLHGPGKTNIMRKQTGSCYIWESRAHPVECWYFILLNMAPWPHGCANLSGIVSTQKNGWNPCPLALIICKPFWHLEVAARLAEKKRSVFFNRKPTNLSGGKVPALPTCLRGRCPKSVERRPVVPRPTMRPGNDAGAACDLPKACSPQYSTAWWVGLFGNPGFCYNKAVGCNTSRELWFSMFLWRMIDANKGCQGIIQLKVIQLFLDILSGYLRPAS